MKAVVYGGVERVDALLAAGADVNATRTNGRTVLLFAAARIYDARLVLMRFWQLARTWALRAPTPTDAVIVLVLVVLHHLTLTLHEP